MNNENTDYMEDKYVIKDGKKLRCGYTTGSCTAASALAALLLLEEGKKTSYQEVIIPNDKKLKLPVYSLGLLPDGGAYASVIKDAGDDPDITDGMEVGVRLRKRNDSEVVITGGEGIGIIKRPGLFGEVGDFAINPAPRKMIEENIKRHTQNGYDVEIYAPKGEEISLKTYNRNMGIEGGVSILGTTGIVEPMSEAALVKTIFMEIDAERLKSDTLLLFPGNYGKDIAESLNLPMEGVKMSNFIGEAVSYAVSVGFKKIILVGHIGKFAKVSLGAFQTHNRTCDLRMEAFVYYLALRGAPVELMKRVNDCLTAEEGVKIVMEEGWSVIFEDMRQGITDRMEKYVKDDSVEFKVHFYSMEKGLLKCYIS